MGNGCTSLTDEQKQRTKKSGEIDSLLNKKLKLTQDEIKLLLLG